MIIFPRLQDLRARIYDPRLQVVTPNLTFAQENTLRGIHMCDIFNVDDIETFLREHDHIVECFKLLTLTHLSIHLQGANHN